METIFGSRIRARILAWFFTHQDEDFFVRQLAIILREDPSNLSRELARLEKVGILSSTRQGNLKYFRTNEKCSFHDELKGLILKTVGVIGEIQSAVEGLPEIEYALIYGSYARGEETADSDIDLMVVGEVDLDKLDSAISGLERRFGRTINYVAYNEKEFKEKRKRRDGFITDVLRDKKIMLVGGERELKKA